MNWKTLAIILLIAVVLIGAYSAGVFEPKAKEDGTTETSESFELAGSIQSDFWDGFTNWLFANLIYILGIVAGVVGMVYLKKSRD